MGIFYDLVNRLNNVKDFFPMASYKNINTDYVLNVNNGQGLFTINANLLINGTVTNTTPAVTLQPFLTVAANNAGTVTDMGLLAQTNTSNFAGLRFDTIANRWEISPSVQFNGDPIVQYEPIATGTAAIGGANTQIQYNDGGAFAASANLAFDFANNILTLSGSQKFVNIGNSIPITFANGQSYLYSNPVGSGGTGLYVAANTINDELVSKSKAIVYSIIF